MKFLKWIFMVVGGVGLLVGIGLLIKNLLDLRVIYQVAIASKSAVTLADPMIMVVWMSVAILVGGLCLGLGIAWPSKLRGTIERELREEKAQQAIPAPPSVPTPPSSPAPPTVPAAESNPFESPQG